MPLDQDAIKQQLDLLAIHRRTLSHLLEQAAQFGGEVFGPPQTAAGIVEARQQISRIKTVLRKNSVHVVDEPSDKAARRRRSVQVPLTDDTGRDARARGGKVRGSERSIQIGVGVYNEAGRDINQKGNIINGGTFIAPIIHEQHIHQIPRRPALYQLRMPVGDFVGRNEEVDQLVQALTKEGGAAAISSVRGMGGIGKTELALVVANQLTETFRDAQLLIELGGSSSHPLTPEQALQAVVQSFEREAKLPNDLGQLKGIYSSVLTGKRVLILTDDARDAAQIRALLPPRGCALLVTSRNRFALPGMTTLDLGTLPREEAQQLLREICPRIGQDAAMLAQLCGYLPLALRISASFLANTPREVPRYINQLQAARLAYLRDPDNPDDPAASIDASLRLSYSTLNPVTQSALCQMSVFSTSFDLSAVQAVVQITGDIEMALDMLLRRCLLEWDAVAARYILHDLVRVFAAEQLIDAEVVRLRHAQHYQGIVSQAGALYSQGATSLLAGLKLFDQERSQIDMAWGWVIRVMGNEDTDALVLAYTDATTHIGDLRYNQRNDRIRQFEAAFTAAQRLGRRSSESAALYGLGGVYAALGETQRAVEYFEKALVITRAVGDRQAEGSILSSLGIAHRNLGNVRQAIEFAEHALVIARAIGDRQQEGNALGNIGSAYYVLGETRRALEYYEQRLMIARTIGDQRGEGSALGNLGIVSIALGETRRAIEFYELALVIVRAIGDRQGEGSILGNLGNAYRNLGDVQRAIGYYEQNLIIARAVGDRQGEASALGNLGSAYYILSEVQRAIEYYEQAIVIARSIGNRRLEGYTLGNLGMAFIVHGETRRAIEHYVQRLEIMRAIGDLHGEGSMFLLV